jgi:hypothetical protein
MIPSYPFKGAGYAFYRRIEPHAFRLNAVLWELRVQPESRRALLTDANAFATRFALTPVESEALAEQDIRKLTDAGAHAILAWGVILLLRYDREHAPTGP